MQQEIMTAVDAARPFVSIAIPTVIALGTATWALVAQGRAHRLEDELMAEATRLDAAHGRIAALSSEIGPLRAFKRKVDEQRRNASASAVAARKAGAAAKREARPVTGVKPAVSAKTKSGRGAARK